MSGYWTYNIFVFTILPKILFISCFLLSYTKCDTGILRTLMWQFYESIKELHNQAFNRNISGIWKRRSRYGRRNAHSCELCRITGFHIKSTPARFKPITAGRTWRDHIRSRADCASRDLLSTPPRVKSGNAETNPDQYCVARSVTHLQKYFSV